MCRRNTDGRRKREGDTCNFYIYYDFDGEEVATVLDLDQYDGTEQYSWVLLEPIEEAAAPSPTEEAQPMEEMEGETAVAE